MKKKQKRAFKGVRWGLGREKERRRNRMLEPDEEKKKNRVQR